MRKAGRLCQRVEVLNVRERSGLFALVDWPVKMHTEEDEKRAEMGVYNAPRHREKGDKNVSSGLRVHRGTPKATKSVWDDPILRRIAKWEPEPSS